MRPEAISPRDVGFVSAYRGPSGFEWLVQGVLGGTPKPGLVLPLEEDLDALLRVGTDDKAVRGLLQRLGRSEVGDQIVDLVCPQFHDAATVVAHGSHLGAIPAEDDGGP